jgi:spore germination cell wall hydrolase CwlJ-like protein
LIQPGQMLTRRGSFEHAFSIVKFDPTGMQVRSTKISGLEPVAEESSLSPAKILVFAGVAALLLLAGALWVGLQSSSPGRLPRHFNVSSTKPGALGSPSLTGALADGVPPQTFAPVTPAQALIMNARVPFSLAPNPAAAPFKLLAANPVDQTRAQTCLTMAIYYEAANQGDVGEAAVAQVVLNRVRNPAFPKTVCGVVFQGSNLPTGCQFTFTCDGSLNRQPDPAGWKRAGLIAQQALNGYVEPLVGDATHYHTVWVVPYWQSTVEKVAQIGAHIFYRWSGPLGQPRSFGAVYAGAEQLPANVHGFGLDPVLSIDAMMNTPQPVERQPPPPEPKPIVTAQVTAPSAADHAVAAALVAPALPPKLETQPAQLSAENPQAAPISNHHLAIPATW